MNKSKLRFNTADEANAVFYEAFMRCDADVMAALWADGDVVCIHPGAGTITGYDSVMRSWSNIFSDAGSAGMNATVIRRELSDELAVYVVAEEMLSSGEVIAVVLATNVYRKFDIGWLMTEHHASLVQSRTNGQTLQ